MNLNLALVKKDRRLRIVVLRVDRSDLFVDCRLAEARHAQHFNRFYEQVLGLDGSFEDRLQRARRDLNPAFVEMFDHVLVEWGRRLVENPRDIEAKVDFVTLYHMIIEGTLALTGQWFLTDYMERHEILPGWVEGFRRISQDEHRHVAYGTWFLREKAEDPDLRQQMIERLAELIPLATAVLVRFPHWRPERLAFGGTLATAAGTTLTGLTPSLGGVYPAQAVGGIGNGIELAAGNTLIQRRTPPAMLGRISGRGPYGLADVVQRVQDREHGAPVRS